MYKEQGLIEEIRHKKAQIEMIGLVIVVILLVIGLLFYFKFGILRDNKQTEDPTIKTAYVTNLMGSILNIKVCDDSYKIEDVLVRCMDDNLVNTNLEFCDGLGSCDYAKREMGQIIADISLKDYKKYSISIQKGVNSVNLTQECRTGIASHTTIVTQDRQYYTVNFRVC